MELPLPDTLKLNEPLAKIFMNETAPPPVINGWERKWVDLRIKTRFLLTALQCYHSPRIALQVIRKLIKFKQDINGRKEIRRCVKNGNRYFFSMYIPGFPSGLFNRYIRTEMNFIRPHQQPVNHLQVLQLAITSRCPLKCEHCFEWDNLNKEEPFNTEQLHELICKFKNEGLSQLHLTGGEPMVNISRLLELINRSATSLEYYVLSAGLNITRENALRLKQAGATGIIISLDHSDPEMHNRFRGSAQAWRQAVTAVINARKAGLITALSLCVTREFISKNNLYEYAKIASELGVGFVQLLEPKAVGHYTNKPVLLNREQLNLLEEFYTDMNFNPAYRHYPVFLYHGHHQRKLGCMSAGKRILYIDAAGHIDACPFCQTRKYEAAAILSGRLKIKNIDLGKCPEYPDKSAPSQWNEN